MRKWSQTIRQTCALISKTKIVPVSVCFVRNLTDSGPVYWQVDLGT